MSEAILTALITGTMSLLGVVVTCVATARKNEQNLRLSQAERERMERQAAASQTENP